MSRVYSEAREFHAWLGEDPSRRELSLVQEAMLTKCPRLLAVSDTNNYSVVAHPDILVPIRNLIETLTVQPYWNRSWIVQEVILAQAVILLFDTQVRLPWDILMRWVLSFGHELVDSRDRSSHQNEQARNLRLEQVDQV